MVLRDPAPGFKYNLTDIAAALGIEQLEAMHQLPRGPVLHCGAMFNAAFADVNRDRSTGPRRPDVEHAWHLYVIQLQLESLGINRAQFIETLKRSRSATSVHFIPLHLHPYYRDRWGYRRTCRVRAQRSIASSLCRSIRI